MYFHGLEDVATQVSRVAISHNGIDFEAWPEILGPSYLRVFQHDGMTYALAMPGQFFRSKDGLHGFEPGPVLFNPNMRHSAVLKRGDELLVFLVASGRGAGADFAQPYRYRGRLARLERKLAGRGAAARAQVGRRRAHRSPPSVRSTAYGHVNSTSRPRGLRRQRADLLLLRWPGEGGIAIAKIWPWTMIIRRAGAGQIQLATNIARTYDPEDQMLRADGRLSGGDLRGDRQSWRLHARPFAVRTAGGGMGKLLVPELRHLDWVHTAI